jgi:coenzyme F420-0:L-glutamate ligase/coenzyme F420-1:gamma-L-glutamate ligase
VTDTRSISPDARSISAVEIVPIHGIGEVRAGDRIGHLIASAASAFGVEIAEGDVVVVTQKVVSKAEGQLVKVSDETERKNVVLRQSRRILRKKGEMVISETHHGFVCANAGVDSSNVEDGYVTVLPKNPDASACRIRSEIFEVCGVDVAVVVSDTFGRAWRRGQTNVAIGVSGMKPIVDYRGSTDSFGRQLEATEIAVADEVASAAELVMQKSAGIPVVLVRHLHREIAHGEGSVRDLLRPAGEDLFR